MIAKYTDISGMLNKQKEIAEITCLYLEHSLFLLACLYVTTYFP